MALHARKLTKERLMQHPQRVGPVDHGNLTPQQAAQAAKMGELGKESAPLLVRTLLNYPDFLRAIGHATQRVTEQCDLPERLRLIGSMRTIWLVDCEYLWAQRREDCLKAGVTDEDLYEIAIGPESQKLDGLDKFMVEAIDELHFVHYSSDETWSGFDQFGDNAAMDTMLTYSYFVTLSGLTKTLGVPLDEGRAGYTDALKALRAAPASGPAKRDPMLQYPKRVEEADYSNLTPKQQQQTARMGRRGKPTTSKLQKAMINYVDFLTSMAAFGKRAIDTTSLPPRVWQLACMRTVWLCDSEYLWSQHRKACLKFGVTDADLLAVAEGPKSPGLIGFDRITVRAVDELYYNNRLSDETWDQFDRFGPEGMTDLVLVYGLYVLQSCVARNFGTTLEPNSLGYLPELEPLRENQQR
tara:strand:- start:193 stop:1428 length:1236 start_codon:yes stop_codon:yes gene_type:complete